MASTSRRWVAASSFLARVLGHGARRRRCPATASAGSSADRGRARGTPTWGARRSSAPRRAIRGSIVVGLVGVAFPVPGEEGLHFPPQHQERGRHRECLLFTRELLLRRTQLPLLGAETAFRTPGLEALRRRLQHLVSKAMSIGLVQSFTPQQLSKASFGRRRRLPHHAELLRRGPPPTASASVLAHGRHRGLPQPPGQRVLRDAHLRRQRVGRSRTGSRHLRDRLLLEVIRVRMALRALLAP